MEILINRSWGGFSLSYRASRLFAKEKGEPYKFVKYKSDYCERNFYLTPAPERNDPVLIGIVKRLGLRKSARDTGDKLRIVEIPDGVDWYIDDYDGVETVHERHRQWPGEDEE